MADDPNAARRRPSRRGSDPGPDDASTVPEAPATEATPDPGPEMTAMDAEPAPEGTPADEPGPEPEPRPPAESEAPTLSAGEPEPDGAESATAAVAASDVAEPEPGTDGATPAEASDEPVPAGVAAATATTLWDASDGNPTASLPWLHARSPDDRICPFLRAVASDDHLGFPVESPDAANRCASMHEAVPQSLRQQELVCLTANHVNCPRYLRGAATTATEVPATRVRPKAVMTPAISAALIILALSFGASVVFGLANGGLAMPSHAPVSSAGASATSVAAESTASPLATQRATPSTVSASAGETPAPTPAPTPSSNATPAPTPTATSAATGPTPKPPSSRSKLLKPCPNKPNCWIYTVKSGDNLFSIAKYFGVPLSRVKSLNPWTRTESLRAGRKLILPNPTR